MEDQPFSAVENVVFDLLIEHLKPRYTLPNQQETAGPHLFTLVGRSLSKYKMLLNLTAGKGGGLLTLMIP